MSWDITNQVQRYNIYNKGSVALKRALADYLGAPEFLIVVNCGHEIKRIAFVATEADAEDF